MSVGYKASGAGIRHVQIVPLDDSLLPLFSGTPGATADGGHVLSLARAFTPTFPDPTIVNHVGDDVIGGVTMLPATEGMTFELRTGMTNLSVDAALSGTEAFALGDSVAHVVGTEKVGLLPDVGLIVYRQATDTDQASATRGATRWVWAIIPQARISLKGGAMENGGDDENTYSGVPMVVNKHLWGVAFSESVEGCIEGQMVRGISHGRPRLAWWQIDATPTLVLTLPANAKADLAGTGFDVKVFKKAALTGVVTDITATSTISATTVTVVGCVEDDLVMAFYSQAD